ncbi:hypothetical protein FEM48_Zijuj11G0125700 [Ziziphus jujuba var. spinosa]|uniref:WRKY domain-containing protein n=1 Tax=Ziziphus jujuba var. spinosa TaxID=714518 RepID=A0A978UIY9_ZIZJJ|nr:hypothetical protein FEM48_Zijuj11G0125700 [Ziziphus jujuba var. spinosa]
MIEELMIGLELANLLPNVVAESDGGSGSAKDLASKIIKSFSNIFTLLNIVREGDDDQVSVLSQIQVEDSSPCLVAWKSEDYSPESCRHPNNTPTKKSRRGCYQRRSSSRTWKRDTPILINDGQAWRQYGQKSILNSKFPRYYYRCAYKYDQGCEATKQVQRIQVEPPLYRTTYFGNHTCSDHDLILEGTGNSSDTSMFISFDGSNLTNKKDQYPLIVSSTKQKVNDEIITSGLVNHNEYSSSSDYFVSLNQEAIPSSRPMCLSTSHESDFDDIINGLMDYVDLDPDVF